MQEKIVSADCHIDLSWLPEDLFTTQGPAHLKHAMPRVEQTDDGRWWMIEDSVISRVAGSGFSGTGEKYVPGISLHLDKMEEQGFFSDADEGLYHPTTPELRLKDQEIDGISGEVIYGILGVASGFAAGGDAVANSEALAEIYGIYNRWASEFCATNPDRFIGLACLTSHDPKVAAQQLSDAADLGLRGAELNVSSASTPIYQPEWDDLWAVSEERRMPISFHTVGLPYRKPDSGAPDYCQYVAMGVNFTLFQLSGAEYLSSIILSGACSSHPDFNFVLGECGVGWIPYVLHRLDVEYKDRLFHLDLEMDPSDYWHRQGHSTFQDEVLTQETVDLVGVDNIMWGSDYPHPDGIWPESRQLLESNLAALDADTRARITYRNAAQLYRFS